VLAVWRSGMTCLSSSRRLVARAVGASYGECVSIGPEAGCRAVTGPVQQPAPARPGGRARAAQVASMARRGARRARSSWADIGWAVFAGLNLAAMRLLPAWQTVPFLVIWVSLAVIYGFRLWRLQPAMLTVAVVSLATGGIIGAQVIQGQQDADYLVLVPMVARRRPRRPCRRGLRLRHPRSGPGTDLRPVRPRQSPEPRGRRVRTRIADRGGDRQSPSRLGPGPEHRRARLDIRAADPRRPRTRTSRQA
jgi:hypothetical protein